MLLLNQVKDLTAAQGEHRRDLLTQQDLKRLLHYDPETGVWTSIAPRANNKVKVGDVEGNLSVLGYNYLWLNGMRYRCCRLAFLYMIGRFPNGNADHINGVKNDDRWSNLREATRAQNRANSEANVNNTTGVKGVYPAYGGKFSVQVRHAGRCYYGGVFSDIEDAAKRHREMAAHIFGQFAVHHRKEAR